MSLSLTAPSCPPPAARRAPQAAAPADFQTLVEGHLPLVRALVERMKRKLPQAIEAEELYSVGVTGLVVAARNYRAAQAGSFAAYAATRIRGAMLDELRRLDWMSRASRSKAKRLGAALARLEQAQGGAVTTQALCAELQMSQAELQELLEEMRPVRLVSLDAAEEAGAEQEERCLHDLIADEGAASAGELVERKELVALVAERIAQLPEMPRKVLALYYYENLRLADIAAAFGLTESRICQIHTQAVKQLRAYLQSVMA
jgi:RNA polymerase sigma factor for flagellar operon FliA